MPQSIHVLNKNNLVFSGNWKNTTFWNFYSGSMLPKEVISTAVTGLIIYKNKIVLINNARGWELPSGHIEPGESTNNALLRELFEETGLQHYKFIKMFGYKEIINPTNIKLNKATKRTYPKQAYVPHYLIEATSKPIGCQDNSCYSVGFFSPYDKEIINSKFKDIILFGYSCYISSQN